MRIKPNRRGFLAGLSASAAAGLLGTDTAQAGELETTTVRIADFPGGICIAPQYIAEEFLRQEGFSEVLQVPTGEEVMSGPLMERNEVDFGLDLATGFALAADRRMPITALAGVHAGCYVLFAREGINTILDLKGRRVGVGPAVGSDPQMYVSVMATYVGLDPVTDIEWVQSDVSPVHLFEEGKVDALLSFPPEAQEVRAGNWAMWSSTACRTGHGQSISVVFWWADPLSFRTTRSPPSVWFGPSSRPPMSA